MSWELWFGVMVCPMVAILAVLIIHVIDCQIEFASVPPPAVAALEESFPGASWRHATTDGDGETIIHKVTVQCGDELFQIAVTPDGRIVEVVRRIHPSHVPAAVRDALASYYPSAEVRRFEEVNRGDAVVAYAAEFDWNRWHPAKVTVDAAGLCVPERLG